MLSRPSSLLRAAPLRRRYAEPISKEATVYPLPCWRRRLASGVMRRRAFYKSLPRHLRNVKVGFVRHSLPPVCFVPSAFSSIAFITKNLQIVWVKLVIWEKRTGLDVVYTNFRPVLWSCAANHTLRAVLLQNFIPQPQPLPRMIKFFRRHALALLKSCAAHEFRLV